MRKAVLLTMAAAIVAMFALPGSASAAWTKHHVANPSDVELEITGTDIALTSSVGGITCIKTISKVLFKGNSTTGEVKTFESELNQETPTITSNCQGTGALAGCDVHEAKADNLPWTIHTATADTVTITTGTLTTTLTGFLCPHTPTLTPGTLTWTVPNDGDATNNQTTTTSTMTLSGTLTGDLPNQVTVHVSGTFHVLGTITYGF